MQHTENDYIQAGYRYESATSPSAARARAEAIRHMLHAEHQTDQAEARRLIDQGRVEARAHAPGGRQ
jgi:hypothetical protein